jgi:hypothetical protein
MPLLFPELSTRYDLQDVQLNVKNYWAHIYYHLDPTKVYDIIGPCFICRESLGYGL